jgi:predicted phage terminase large subunit-like protein
MQAMRDLAAWARERWPQAGHTILIEKSANGAEIIAALKRELSGVNAIITSTSKINRAMAAAALLEAGNIHLPSRQLEGTAAGYHAPDWVAAFIEEAATFPKGRHDDQVDSFSQAVNGAHDRAPIIMRTYLPPPIRLDNPRALGLGGAFHDLTLEAALRSHHNW